MAIDFETPSDTKPLEVPNEATNRLTALDIRSFGGDYIPNHEGQDNFRGTVTPAARSTEGCIVSRFPVFNFAVARPDPTNLRKLGSFWIRIPM